jgi:hypothetical protein
MRAVQATAFVAIGISCVAPAHGQAVYDVSHSFNIRTNGNIPPAVFHQFVVDTYARTDAAIDNPPRIRGTHAIGAGLHFDNQSAGPVPSWAYADSEANITTLAAGRVIGTVRVDGIAAAVLGDRSAVAGAYSYSKVRVRGQKVDRRGNVRFTGRWKSSKPVAGRARSTRGVVRDPVVARLINRTTGVTEEWTLISVHNEIEGGTFEWDNNTLSNTARDMIFDLKVPGAITTQAGTLYLRVEKGIVTAATATGMYAATAIPAAGSSGTFSMALPNLIEVDYDMGGNAADDLVPELEFDNGADAKDAAAKGHDNGGTTTDIGSGFENANISVPPLPIVTLGIPTMPGMFHVADDFIVEPTLTGQPTQLDVLALPLFQQGFGPNPMPVDAVFVRIWEGNPMLGGFPIAGNLFENRLLDVRDLNTYRIDPSEPLHTNERPMVEALIAMDWAPPLVPGEYWLELTAQGPAGEVFVVPATNRTDDENALFFVVPANQWQPAQDPSGLMVDLAFDLRYVAQEFPCLADFDQSTGVGVLDIFDFLAFQDAFVNGSSKACNFNISTGVNNCDIFDFLGFQNAFVAGCR